MSFIFDSGRAYAHTHALCFPRRVGTARERRAAGYIWRTFTACGLACQCEPFQVSHFCAEIGSRLALVLSALLIVAGVLLFSIQPIVAAFCWFTAALAVNSPWRLGKLFGSAWPPRTTSHNILATLPKLATEAPARVIFMAHYDTKSQLLPTGIRVALVASVTALCGAGAILTGLVALNLIVLPAGGAWTAAISLFLLAVLMANVSGNRSPGALDNGSAVGTLLELARAWRPRADAPLDVYWVASGAEEVGLDGARHFLKQREEWWHEKPTLLINLESVGAGSRLFLAGERQTLRLARETADALGLSHGRLRVVGAGMDHEPFAARGLSALSILGDVVRTSLALHSRRDDMRLIDRAALARAARLAAHLAWRWATRHAPCAEPRLSAP